MSNKICPIMSGTPVYDSDGKRVFNGIYHCRQDECQLWIEVYTDESLINTGCALELQPQMREGLFRV